MAASQTIKQQLLKLSTQWPKDFIRPNHQFSEAIAQVAESQPAWASTSSSAGGAGASGDVKDGQALVGALERLHSSRALKEYPLSERTKKPPSMPKHYSNLMEGLKKAERGETEPWWKSAFRFRK